ncbi:hypothetical protein [Kaarinaea lacus]
MPGSVFGLADTTAIPTGANEAAALERIGISASLELAFKNIPKQIPTSNQNQRHEHLLYDFNGLTIEIQYIEYSPGHAVDFQELKSHSDINKHVAQGVNLISSSMVNVNFPGQVNGFTQTVVYSVPPMIKEQVYHISNLVKNNKHWIVSSSYKSCDEKGKRLAHSFLRSLKFSL